ncbi:cysteine proteinase inhibitor 12-like isoform X2 [Lotus japonicus]|uniref:cysteine proteinase inhibitor 12-like isoform X2 n=1 Tax=Lotus japonicus TaxID=34305 RepID=UPI00258808E2|nr:cysteine proteinase inhibitor 12-like isoform X2 [Lotus japonicus]
MTKLLVFFVAFMLPLSGFYEFGLCTQQDNNNNNIITMNLGARDATPDGAAIENLARFAVHEHNKKENALLEFARVLKTKEQVIAGKIYYLTLEAIDGGKKKIYEAKIWVKPWMNFIQLQEFKLAHVTSPFRSSDLGVKQEGHIFGWYEVPIHNSEVKDAANYAVKSIAKRSNSLSPYELREIVLAKTKKIEDYVKFNLLLKVSRGIKEEIFRVEVNKKLGGRFYVSWLQQDHS